ncbi:aspercryptin biosynthesis cluster protein B [Colletotrichum liriopes]|uniref:Aspercryptin biosynthesis cluster protein B n=1 Tax=Colletotrichum liriopes TaxID=708192 RepID=A0AA37GBJ3_9PEZI|nr:aspercryptin biosynthesis cluster protein B [Colletotrichum liriopes]
MAVGGAMFTEHPTEGKTPSFTGSALIYTVKDAEEAWELIRNDIYAKSDVWDLEKAQVIPFKSAVRESL